MADPTPDRPTPAWVVRDDRWDWSLREFWDDLPETDQRTLDALVEGAIVRQAEHNEEARGRGA